MNSKYIELAKKLLVLSERGERGEADNARAMLDAFMCKHKITFDDLRYDVIKERRFKISSDQRQFFAQIAASVVGKISTYYRSGWLYVNLSEVDYIEVSLRFPFYWKLYTDELDIFYNAFIQANRLFRKPSPADSESSGESEISEKDLRIMAMMDTVKRASPSKQISSKSNTT